MATLAGEDWEADLGKEAEEFYLRLVNHVKAHKTIAIVK